MAMWICAVSHRTRVKDVLEDTWTVHDSERAALDALEKEKAADNDLYCWAVAPISHGSEPQYTDDWEQQR